MCTQISPENVIGSALLFKEKLSICELKILENNLTNELIDCMLDLSRDSVLSVLESWEKYFYNVDDTITLSNYYSNNIARVKYRFFDTMDDEFKITLKRLVTCAS